MINLLRRLYDWWNPPCLKHTGHRMREIDTELATQCAMCPYPGDMCSECFLEAERLALGYVPDHSRYFAKRGLRWEIVEPRT